MCHKKISFLLIALLSLTFNFKGFSQDDKPPLKNEIGLGVPNVNFLNEILIANFSFKTVKNKNAFRSGVSYGFFRPKYENYSSLLINVGYERRFFKKKSKLLLGADLCYLFTTYDRKGSWPYEYKHTFYHVGLGPVLGYIYQPLKKISFQTECGFYYGPGKSKDSYNENDIIVDNGKYYTFHRYLSLHVYYHF